MIALSLPKPQDHLRKQPHRTTGKPGTLHQRAMLAYRNAGKTTVAAFLASIGATQAFIDQYGAAFGTKASTAFQARYGRKPAQCGLALRKGRLFRAFAYTAEQATVLIDAARSYNRTADLIGA